MKKIFLFVPVLEYGRRKWPITMLNHTNRETSLVHKNDCFLFERSEFLIDTSQIKSLRVCTRAVCTRAMCSTSLGLSVSYYVPHTYVSQLGSQDTYM